MAIPFKHLAALFVAASSFLAASRILAQHTAPPQDVATALIRLHVLGYWTDTTQSAATYQNKQAIIAFQKVSRLKRTGILSEQVMTTLWRASIPVAKDSMHKRHVEVDLDRQVLLLVDSLDKVERILAVSTGNGKQFFYPGKGLVRARTPRGHFRVYYKINGWRKSQLGLLYDPLYVTGGVAIHGAKEVPVIPASHGCIRIPLFAANEMFRTTPIGTPVMIYGENPS
ncbi:MAG: L,D-transpeptidase family protein [Bacteroidota bacterium]|nr:L,D-transpeptidase family protein [Bacteroidota bacterium]MDP4235271.1 L,D-transpeptidase family protein [Bacteroidota bacterium]